jgi:hypothetical protein
LDLFFNEDIYTTIIVIREKCPTILDGYGWTFQPKRSPREEKVDYHTHIKSHPIVPIYKTIHP